MRRLSVALAELGPLNQDLMLAPLYACSQKDVAESYGMDSNSFGSRRAQLKPASQPEFNLKTVLCRRPIGRREPPERTSHHEHRPGQPDHPRDPAPGLPVRLDVEPVQDECWEWTGKRNDQQYGYLSVFSKTLLAHRVSYFLANGMWPQPVARHLCHNPSCVNPGHLVQGTRKDNWADRKALLAGVDLLKAGA